MSEASTDVVDSWLFLRANGFRRTLNETSNVVFKLTAKKPIYLVVFSR